MPICACCIEIGLFDKSGCVTLKILPRAQKIQMRALSGSYIGSMLHIFLDDTRM